MSTYTKKIIVATDFSDSSAVALYHAMSLAEELPAELHIAHISQASLTVPTDLGMNLPQEFEEAQNARQRLERLRAMIGSSLDVELHLRIGHPVHELLELIREIRPQMVVVGSHGKGAMMRMLLGSVSTELMRRSPVPVLVVPAPGREAELDRKPPAEPVAADAGMPAVGQAMMTDTHEYGSFTSGTVGMVGTAPGGTSGYDVNPELRVRY
jgi:nucleotide-binding universal stress UspA family protein